MIDRIVINTGPAVGADGSASATAYSPHVSGKVLAVYVAYLNSPPAGTTDFTLSDEADPTAESIITLVNAATDIKVYPNPNNRASEAGHDCERYLVYSRLNWSEKIRHDARLQRVFDEGYSRSRPYCRSSPRPESPSSRADRTAALSTLISGLMIVVFTPTMRNSSSARRMRRIASARLSPCVISFASNGSYSTGTVKPE